MEFEFVFTTERLLTLIASLLTIASYIAYRIEKYKKGQLEERLNDIIHSLEKDLFATLKTTYEWLGNIQIICTSPKYTSNLTVAISSIMESARAGKHQTKIQAKEKLNREIQDPVQK